MNTDIIRQKYLEFFARYNHKVVASSSLVPIGDPTLLFTSAGMNQFKKEFLGQITSFRRATSAQRCLRTDDLDKVGQTASHHTFFEMLGNFSFGDYFKKEAIVWAWEFLTKELHLNPGALWASVYTDDDEAYKIWLEIVCLPEQKIVKLGASDNFWPANAVLDGPNGPCGPCSEIFYDFGADIGCQNTECKPGCSCGRFVEIWNLVFTQFNRNENGKLKPLPNKNIDTGMGLERIASVLQNKKSNFEIDIFLPIIKEIESDLPSETNYQKAEHIKNINAIADHARAIVFAIYDGVSPSNEQRGYVVRKLIRKAGFHGYTIGIKKPFLYKLTSKVAQVYRQPYPDLLKRVEDIASVILSEEKLFASTLNDAPRILETEFMAKYSKIGTGHAAFILYDTYGIPLEITKSLAQSKKIDIDEAQFLGDLKEQRNRSRKSSKIKDSVFADSQSLLVGIKPTKFIGYDKFQSESKILSLAKEGAEVENIQEGENAQIILEESPFYGESGGQVGDKGIIYSKESEFIVEDTVRQNKIFLHCGKVTKGSLKVGNKVFARIDINFRKGVMRAHTATHILQFALRKVLGEHVRQAGSLVEYDRLRFDFTHFKQVSNDELKRLEQLVTESILSLDKINTELLPVGVAKEQGALAFFGEKYEEKVRVVSIGEYSKELCGGTHLSFPSEIGSFKIINESSIAKGIRRIEALSGNLAFKKIQETEENLNLTIKSKEEEVSALKKEILRLHLNIAELNAKPLYEKTQSISGCKVIAIDLPDQELSWLRHALDFLKSEAKNRAESYAFCLSSTDNENKSWLVISISDDLTKEGLDAAKIIKEIAPFIGGDGGGRTNMAQAGGANTQGKNEALNRFIEIIKIKLNPDFTLGADEDG